LERKASRVDHSADNMSVLITYVRQTWLEIYTVSASPHLVCLVYNRPIRTNILRDNITD